MEQQDVKVQTLSEVRAEWGSTLRRFRRGDRGAIAFGRQGRFEAVLIPYSVYEKISSLLNSDPNSSFSQVGGVS